MHSCQLQTQKGKSVKNLKADKSKGKNEDIDDGNEIFKCRGGKCDSWILKHITRQGYSKQS